MFQHQDKYNKGLASRRSWPIGGFTLIEALVALTLLTVGLIPVFVQATNAMKLSTNIRNSVIAADLAQEGIEVIHGMRDANWFVKQPFDAGFAVCSSGCLVQWNSTLPESLGENPPLKLDNGLYQYGLGVDTGFSRKITIANVSPVELVVMSTVTWRERSLDKQFVLEEHLFDWVK